MLSKTSAAPEVGRIRTAAVTISNVNTTPLFSPFWTSVVIRDVTYLGPLVSITFVYVESIPRCRRAHRSNRMRKRMESGDGLFIARSCGADEMISEKKMMMLDEPIFCQRESPPMQSQSRGEPSPWRGVFDGISCYLHNRQLTPSECVLASLLDGVGRLFQNHLGQTSSRVDYIFRSNFHCRAPNAGLMTNSHRNEQ